ncbi:MAG: ATP-binding protein [Candidatus Goldbacteria bacterium]|nr:ATP-binding protein [Candidatus Goldiibacteriota bacterium]
MKTYIKRDIESRIKKYINAFPAVSLTGPRQCGKTTVLREVLGKEYAYVSLDDTRQRAMAINDPALFVKKLPEKVIIDELQYAPAVMSYIKIEIDNARYDEREIKGRFVITGSQNFLLMKSFTESLAGRVGILHMNTLSSGELAVFTGADSTRLLFEFACTRGTYPEPVLDKTMDIPGWYESYLTTYIDRDVRSLYNVGNLETYDKFIRILASRPGQLLNMAAVSNDCGVSASTIKKWLSILEASGIIFYLHPYHANVRTRLVKTPKIYFYDTGLVCRVNNIRTENDIYSHAMAGQIFENYCVSEAKKKLLNTSFYKSNMHFYRADKGPEIDLLVEEKGKFHLFEFKSGINVGSESAKNIELVIAKNKKVAWSTAHVVTLGDGAQMSHITQNVKITGLIGMLEILKGIE